MGRFQGSEIAKWSVGVIALRKAAEGFYLYFDDI